MNIGKISAKPNLFRIRWTMFISEIRETRESLLISNTTPKLSLTYYKMKFQSMTDFLEIQLTCESN